MKNVGGGENGISTKVLFDVCCAVGTRLLDVINRSLLNGDFPEAWKESTVIPVPKVPGTKLCKEFRPINTVAVYEKVLELTAKKQLQDHCDRNKILVIHQSGFRERHSCESVVINICDVFLREIDKGNFVLAVFLDFKRAFETVDRSILLRKLNSIGIRHTALKWFRSYLTNRHQRVKFKDCISESLPVQYGVPQGTVLGPLLFLLYINDIVTVVKGCKIELFADDTMIYLAGKDLVQMQQIVNNDLNNLFKWLCDNNLSINASKSKCCLFGKKYSLKDVDLNNINIIINNQRIIPETQIKYLGVIFDSFLNFYAHSDYIMRKFSKKISFIARIGNQLSMGTKLLLYNSIAAPHLEFCSTLLFNLPNFKIEQLQIIQNRAMRTILKCNRYTPIVTMLNVLNVLSVKQKITYSVLVFLFKIKNNMLPSYVCDRVKFFRDVHNYSTRNRNDFILSDKCCTTQMLDSVLYRGLHDFNMLPNNIKSCDNLNLFKKLVRAHVLLLS